jgi:hypothetical protein
MAKGERGDVAELSRRSNPPTILDIEDFNESINILCHGDTGAGKNRLWGRLPKMVILAIEEGTISIKKAGVKGVKVIRCHSWPDIVGAYEYLRDNPNEFDWVMIDSITKAQSMCIRHIMQMVVLANPSRDIHVPSQGDHFKWQLSIKQMVEDFNELPINTVWLARSMVKENPDGDDIIVPSIEGKDYGISAWVCGEMSLLCYLKKVSNKNGEVSRELYTNEHAVYWCKDWYDVLPHVITFKSEVGVANKIIDLIDGSGKSPQRETMSGATRTPKKRAAKKVARTRKA